MTYISRAVQLSQHNLQAPAPTPAASTEKKTPDLKESQPKPRPAPVTTPTANTKPAAAPVQEPAPVIAEGPVETTTKAVVKPANANTKPFSRDSIIVRWLT